jgi:mercuric ion binding protein
MKTIIAIALLAASLSAQAAQSLKAEVHGMVCAFCAQGIEKKLRALSQTQDVYVNLKDRVVAVEMRDGQSIAPQAFKDLVKDAGYEVVSVETVAQSAKQIKAGAK